MNTFKLTENEYILEDDYPVYSGFVYIVDNIFTSSPMTGTVSNLKSCLGASEVRRCDLFAHDGARLGDGIN